MHCALRPILCGAQTARLLCFSPSIKWGLRSGKVLFLRLVSRDALSVHWGSPVGGSCHHARFLAALFEFGEPVCVCCTQAHIFPL